MQPFFPILVNQSGIYTFVQAQKVLAVLGVPRQEGMFSGRRKLNSPLTSLVSSYMTRSH